ncbi:hypothetical protein F443_10013 [Phytophthora nicotianae P1569]|uniref:Ubiquitin-like protease family profile domain-containing protein n=3 Tax=Phytophthora nicotianae TaxID=4792 RepID=V9F1I9_PHYNI|nr:hypothetical protein F443_10013 [Phytophthora nicotianae P1569]
MLLVGSGHNFEVFPVIRFTTDGVRIQAALDVKDDLAEAADLLKPILQMSKLKSPKVKLPEDDHTDEQTWGRGATAARAKNHNEVAYVRLYRRERANQVVLSSSEKYSYAKAILEPLIDHLSCLSSAKFYQEFAAWKEKVDIGLNRSKSSGNERSDTDNDLNDDGDNGHDALSAIDPSDAMETVKLMNEVEGGMPATDGCTDSGNGSESEEFTPPTQRTKLQDSSSSPYPPSDVALSKKVGDASNSSKTEEQPEEKAAAIPIRAVNIINVPKPQRRGNSRVTTKQLRQTKLNPSGMTSNLKFVLEMLDKYPVQLEDPYLRSRNIECQWEALRPKDYMHNFVIPVDLTRSFQAAVTTAKQEQRRPNDLQESVKNQGFVLDVVATVDPKLWKFSGQFVGVLTGFHALKTRGHMWIEGLKWLEQDWRKVTSNVSLFSNETKTQGSPTDAACNQHRMMANKLIAKFTSSRLLTEFRTLSGTGSITFENIVGGICRGWLNDSPSSSSFGWPSIPKISLARINIILHAVNLDGNHWGIIIIRLQMTNTDLRVHVYMYEPLVNECYYDGMQSIWEGVPKDEKKPENDEKEGLRGYPERWHTASMSGVKLSISKIEWLLTPNRPMRQVVVS